MSRTSVHQLARKSNQSKYIEKTNREIPGKRERREKIKEEIGLQIGMQADSVPQFLIHAISSLRHSSVSPILWKNINDEENIYLTDEEDDITEYIPKDSVQVLEELIPTKLIFLINDCKSYPSKKVVKIKFDDKVFIGFGKSESIAKQEAAEHALKDLFSDMIMSTMLNNTNNVSQYNSKSWKLLGSFAMFKLIEDWLLFYSLKNSSNENSHASKTLDNLKNTNKNISNSSETNVTCSKTLSVNNTKKKVLPNDTNSVVLLNALLGKLVYKDLCINNNKPPFCFSLLIDGVEYVGEPAGCKKNAKQNVAKKVLIKKFCYEFVE